MKEHFDQTLKEAQDRLTGKFAADVRDYDAIHSHILEMADTLSAGTHASSRSASADPCPGPGPGSREAQLWSRNRMRRSSISSARESHPCSGDAPSVTRRWAAATPRALRGRLRNRAATSRRSAAVAAIIRGS
jgi:hypothetical protein